MKLHLKGFLLKELSQRKDAWDYELISSAMIEYEESGRRWKTIIRAALDEMAAGTLIDILEERLDDGTYIEDGKVLFRYRLTDFGRTRMIDTGLLPA